MSRRPIQEHELGSTIGVWLGKLPPAVMRRYVEYQVLKLFKRQGDEVDINSEVGRLIATELKAKGWEVTAPEPKSLGSPPPCSER